MSTKPLDVPERVFATVVGPNLVLEGFEPSPEDARPIVFEWVDEPQVHPRIDEILERATELIAARMLGTTLEHPRNAHRSAVIAMAHAHLFRARAAEDMRRYQAVFFQGPIVRLYTDVSRYWARRARYWRQKANRAEARR